MIRTIIFDFDGVLCESVSIKTDAFYELYLPYGEDIAQKVKEHHMANGGMSRFDKFEYYEKTFLKKNTLSEARMKTLSKDFSKLVMQKVIQAPFVKGAEDFLKNHSKAYQCFIVSATPMEEMLEIAKEKQITPYFQEIFGSPKNKIEWCKYIIDTYHINVKETLFIGDAQSDYKAAKFHGMHFLLRNTDENKNIFTNTLNSINTLENLNLAIKSVI